MCWSTSGAAGQQEGEFQQRVARAGSLKQNTKYDEDEDRAENDVCD